MRFTGSSPTSLKVGTSGNCASRCGAATTMAMSRPSLMKGSADGIPEDIFAVAARTSDTVSTRSVEILEPNDTEIPPESQLRQLAEDTLLLFNEAIQNGGDFSGLYAAASDRWKYRVRDPKMDPYNNDGRVTIAAFRKAFAAAIDAKVDISPIRGKKMILSEPARVNSDGVLILNGTFDAPVFQASIPGSPRRVVFMLEYVREAAQWKLFGLTVNILAPEKKAGSNR